MSKGMWTPFSKDAINMKCLVLALILMLFMSDVHSWALEQQTDCEVDYWPCTCRTFHLRRGAYHHGGESGSSESSSRRTTRTNIHCDRIFALDAPKVFARQSGPEVIAVHLLELVFSAITESTTLKPDLLGEYHRVQRVRLICPDRQHKLVIHPDAFRDSREHISEFYIDNCDLSQVDGGFAFLAGFSALNELYVRSSVLGTFQGLPPDLPLRLLDINHCSSGFQWNVTKLPSALSVLRLDGNHLDDVETSRILRSASKSSISDLVLSHNHLSFIPEEINSLAALPRRIRLNGNRIPLIDAGSFRFRPSSSQENGGLAVLDLGHLHLSSIQPGAFQQGTDFVDCFIHLNGNRLTEFSSAVYQPVLEAIYRSNQVSPHRGAVFIDYNPIRCDCGLSWLIRDHRHLMPFVRGGTCSNSSRFNELDPIGFDHCHSNNEVIWDVMELAADGAS